MHTRMFNCKFVNKVIFNSFIGTYKCNLYFLKFRYKTFTVSIQPEINVNDPDPALSKIILTKNLQLSKLSINILQYLENNFELYNKLCEESIKLAYEISDTNEGNDYLKNELMRVNRQISTFSKDNFYFEEYQHIVREMISSNELLIEASELNDEEFKKSANKDLEELKKKLQDLQNEIIEHLIPNQSVYFYIILIDSFLG